MIHQTTPHYYLAVHYRRLVRHLHLHSGRLLPFAVREAIKFSTRKIRPTSNNTTMANSSIGVIMFAGRHYWLYFAINKIFKKCLIVRQQQHGCEWVAVYRWLPKHVLTHWDRVTHICASKLSYHWFRYWLVACSMPSHYLTQWWFIVEGTYFSERYIPKCNNLYAWKWINENSLFKTCIKHQEIVFSRVKVHFHNQSYILRNLMHRARNTLI